MKTRIFLLCLSLITIPSSSIFAEEEVSVFDEVVVTARKRAEYSQSVPIPISALNEEQLEIRNIVELTDIEKLAPNLSIQASSVNSGVLEVYMRGIGQGTGLYLMIRKLDFIQMAYMQLDLREGWLICMIFNE